MTKISKWTGDFAKCLGWLMIFGTDRQTNNNRRKSVSEYDPVIVTKDNYPLPDELKEYNYYFPDTGHVIMAIPKCLLPEAISHGDLDMFECPMPVKYVLEKGYETYKKHIVVEAPYGECGVEIDESYEEY